MGNCLIGGLGEPAIRVTNSNGGVMEFFPPVTAGIIAAEFPGHAIFRSHDLFWKPLSHHHDLLPGHSYYLLPLASAAAAADDGDRTVREGHVRSSSVPAASLGGASASAAAPYRMSLDYQGMLKRSYTDVFSRAPYGQGGLGFWRVKLVISPEQLAEILSQEGKTQELIESVRTVAKCGGGGGGGGGGFSAAAAAALSGGFSDQWSLSSSSRNASSKVDELMVDIIS